MNISKTLFDEFQKEWREGKYAGQRYGQAFYNHFSLHKCNHGPELDRLYNATDAVAKVMVLALIDPSN